MQRKKPIQVNNVAYRTMVVPEFLDSLNTRADGDILPLSESCESYNFDFNRGVLERGYGLISSHILASNVQSVWLFKRENAALQEEKIVMYSVVSGEVFYSKNGGAFSSLSGVKFSSMVMGINYRLNGKDVILLCSGTDPLTVWDGETAAYAVAGSPQITDMTIHFERMFVLNSLDKNAVWFSDDLDPTNWNPSLDEGGFIQFADERGRPEKVLSFLGYVYVFRRNGITRISALGEQSSFSTTNLYVPSGKIYGKTVALCGDRVVMLSDDGLLNFDGLNVSRLGKNITPLIVPSDFARGCCYNGKYYLACHAKFSGVSEADVSNNALVIIDLGEGKFSISRIEDINGLFPLSDSEGLFAVLKNGKTLKISKCGAINGAPTHKVWKTGMSDIGSPSKNKKFRQLFIRSKEDITITIKTESKTKIKTIKGSDLVSTVSVNMQGKLLGLVLESDTLNPKISSVAIEFA